MLLLLFGRTALEQVAAAEGQLLLPLLLLPRVPLLLVAARGFCPGYN